MNIFKKAIKEVKDLDAALTECKTPKFRKPTAPPPPNPNPNYTPPPSVVPSRPAVYMIRPEELDRWVQTKAQIGDVAYHYDHIGNCYIYCYRKPDDNPFWEMIDPEFALDYVKKESKGDCKMNNIMYGLKLYLSLDDLNNYIRNHVDKIYKDYTFIPVKTEFNEPDFGIEISLISAVPIESNGYRYKLDLNKIPKENQDDT